jgi:methyltransferase (TIGR00027 family)
MGRDTTKGSATALGNLAMACVANSERDPTVRNKDAIAPRLLRWSDGSFAAAKIHPLHPVIRCAAGRLCPGIYGYALARGHHMDQILRQELTAGIDALVILGAGYDTRAYRMRELAEVRVLEVDHPATSRQKRSRLARALRSMPTNVSFVEVDFTHQDLLERLADHGQERSAGTLFLLSGVSMYLSGDAMASLFEQVAVHTSERTSLLFDYVDADVLTAPDRYYGKEWVAYATKVGEEPQWGIPAGEAEAVLGAHGLQLASDVDAEELTARYLRRADGSSVARPFEFGAIAHAFVAGSREAAEGS